LTIPSSLALPLAFIINSFTLSQLKVSFEAGWFGASLKNLSNFNFDFYYRKFISLPDLLYTYNFNLGWLYLGLSAFGLGFVFQHKQIKKYLIFIFGLIIVGANYLLLKTMIQFFSLRSYEQINYSNRVLELSVYLLAPFILIGLYLLFQKLHKNSLIFSLMVFILLALAQTAAFYYTYPRVDKIKEDHGYSTSATDLKTVAFLEKIQSQPQFKPYAVLAAQPVSAAAIKELGFKHYYNNLFFYPVPTGGKLYQLYENFAYGKQKTSEIIATAKYLTGLNTVYVIINDYWLDAEKIIETEKENASEWFSIDNKNYIFKY